MALKGFIKGLLGGNDINDDFFVYDNIFSSDKYVSVILDGKCGVVKTNSWKEVVPCKYPDVWDVVFNYKYGSNICVLCLRTGKWIYLNSETWKEHYPCHEPYLYNYISSSNIAIIKKDNKYLFLNKSGEQIQSYAELHSGRETYLVRDQYSKWGILNKNTGNQIVPFIYDNVEWIVSTPFFFVLRNSKYGIIDSRSGAEVVPCKYDAYKECETGMLPICMDEKWGFLDRDTLEEKIPCVYQDVSVFCGDYAAVKQRGKWGSIDKKNRKIIPSKYLHVLPTPSGLFCVWESEYALEIVDSKGEVVYRVFSNSYDNVLSAIKKSGYCVKLRRHEFNSYLRTTLCYHEDFNLSKGCKVNEKPVSRGYENGKYGYYDGYEKVPCLYDKPVVRCAENLYRVVLRGKLLHYNALTEKEIKDFKYSVSPLNDSTIIIHKDGKSGLMSLRDMKESIPCVCEDYKRINDWSIAFKKNGKWGIFNSDGKPIIIKHTIVEDEKPKESRSANAKQDKPVTKAPKETTKSTDIDTLINASIIDGELSDKERKVLMKKAKLAGLDVDEFEILLDAKLYEVQSKEEKKAKKSKADQKIAKPKVEKKVAKSKEEKKTEKAKTEKKATKSKVEKDARAEKKEKVKAKTTEKPKSTRKVAKEEKKPIKKASTKVAKSKK